MAKNKDKSGKKNKQGRKKAERPDDARPGRIPKVGKRREKRPGTPETLSFEHEVPQLY
jgi:hypothetical protein